MLSSDLGFKYIKFIHGDQQIGDMKYNIYTRQNGDQQIGDSISIYIYICIYGKMTT